MSPVSAGASAPRRPAATAIHTVDAIIRTQPLALLELPGSLSEEQLNGRVPLPDAMPLTPRLEGVFRQRIGRLPRYAQTALLIAAADNTGDAPAVLRAVATLELPADSLDPAEGCGLIRITGKTIAFRHPLFSAGLAAIGIRLAADGPRGWGPGPAADSNGDSNSQQLLAAADDSA